MVAHLKWILIIAVWILFHAYSFAQWNTDSLLTIGQRLCDHEDYVLSIPYFNQAIKMKPYLAEPYLYRAISKLQLGDYKSAEEDCTEALSRNPFIPHAYYVRGFARERLGLYPKAIEDYSKALEFNPNGLHLLLSRMYAMEQNEDYEGALKDAETYQKLTPKTTSIYFDIGRLKLSLKDTLGATKNFDNFLAMDSASSLGWSARAFMRMQKNDEKGALADYTEAIKRKSTNVGDYINRAILNVKNKNFNQALNDYNAAIKLDKKNDLALYNRGLLRSALGDNNNALLDFEAVLRLDSTNIEAWIRKCDVEITLKDYENAIVDYRKIIEKYPYFVPAYEGIAEAYEKLQNEKEAFRYRQLAYNIEKNKDYIKQQQEQDKIRANNKIARNIQNSNAVANKNLFNRFAAQNIDESETKSKYENKIRGTVQDNYTDVVNERDFFLTYYAKTDEIRQTNLYYPTIEQYNKTKKLSSVLKITNNEIPLTAELISAHFDAINTISSQLAKDNTNADIYFNRALEFALVQNFNSAIEDLNKAITLRPDFMLAYFCRANIRNKAVEYIKLTMDNPAIESKDKRKADKQISVEKQAGFDVEMILHDFEKVNELNPDFSFSYYNKANFLCTQKDFRTAIANYTKAIEIDHEFAEAYYNRGLTYLFIGEDAKGLADLSKAGESGIYKAYNLIQRFKK